MSLRLFDKCIKPLIALVVIAIFGSMAYAYFLARYRAVIAEETSKLERVANDLESHFSGRLVALKALAADPDVRSLNLVSIDAELTTAMNAIGCFGIAIADLQGDIIVDPTGIQPAKVRDEDSFTKVIKGQSLVSNRIVPDTIDNAFISLRVPIYDTKGQVQAALIAGVPLTEIANLFWEPTQLGAQYIFVIDGNGNLIYHPNLKDIYPEPQDLKSFAKDASSAKWSGYLVAPSLLDNNDKLFIFTTVSNTSWRIVKAMPLMTVYAIVLHEALPDLLIFGLLITCVGLLLARLRQERKYVELRENVRLERLMSVNQLAAGIAHEIRNPLTSIKGFIQLILIKGDRPAPRSYLEISLSEIERIEKLIKEFHLLARPLQEPHLERLDVTALINDVILLMESQALSKSVALEFQANHPVFVLGEAAQLKQVWINLLRNAIEAVDKGGSVHVGVSIQNNVTLIAVQDNGPGIPDYIIEQMGTPFFTTKDGGTGLGLSVCYSIIEHYNGKIKVESSAGEGTTFTVLLPLAETIEDIS